MQIVWIGGLGWLTGTVFQSTARRHDAVSCAKGWRPGRALDSYDRHFPNRVRATVALLSDMQQIPNRASRFNGARNAFRDTPSDHWKDMTIVVIGCGPVALCAIISSLEYKPARIFVVDSIPSRLERAKDLGCIPLNFKEVDIVAEIMKATDDNGAHAVIEVVGLSPALKTAYDIICPGGKISSVGMYNLLSHEYD